MLFDNIPHPPNKPAALDDLLHQICPVAIAKMTIIRHGQDQHVRLFADFDGADRIGPADGVRGIDGGGGDGLCGSQLHGAASQRNDKLHRLVPCGAGVAVGGEGEDGIRFDEFARGGVIVFGKPEGRAGQGDCNRIRFAKRGDICIGGLAPNDLRMPRPTRPRVPRRRGCRIRQRGS